MRVCFFGTYVKDSYGIPSGNGGALLKMILEKQKVQVIECHDSAKNFSGLVGAYVRLLSKHRGLDYDVMLIPWRGVLTMPVAKLIHKKPIVYFPAFSIYDTLVNDRKKIKKNAIKAKFAHLVDSLSCKWSDRVALESTVEIDYFVKEFGLQKEKFFQIPLASDESMFYPQSKDKSNDKFTILFFGSFIPLHGIEAIVKAATILQNNNDIYFTICGVGQTKPEIEELIKKNNLKNMNLVGLISKEELVKNIKNSDICLGIFGNTLKAQKVVTNKVFQILASKKPLITMESPAATESGLENNENCILVPPADPQRLTDAILFMKDDPQKRDQIATNGYKLYNEKLSMNFVGKKLVKVLEELTHNSET